MYTVVTAEILLIVFYLCMYICFIACLLQLCTPGSNCTLCESTGERYCVQSCAINNGGCDEEQICTEVSNPDCNPNQCCSPVNVTCSGKHLICDCNMYVYK